MKRKLGSILAGAALAASTLFAADTKMVGGAAMYPSKDIIDNAVNSKDHTTLVAAVKAAGLVDTLKGKGPFTVFAPTNEAFAKLPAGTVDTLLKPENKDTLTKVLTYHVVPGEVLSGSLKDGMVVTTVEGETLTVGVGTDGVTLTDASGNKVSVAKADIEAGNGVVHVIDGVLLPAG